MSPRFDFNPADALAGIPVYPKGSYELVLGEPKSFYRAGKGTKADNYGVMFKSKVAEGEFKDKPYIENCYMHTEESRGFSKQVQMAALGFDPKKPEDEEKFNRDFGGKDWTFNSDDGTCGDGWHLMKGQHIIRDLDKGINEATGEPQQKAVGIRPLGHPAAQNQG